MRYALLSDVHANLPALEATLAALRGLGVDRYVCAGDVVGYGPHPVACIERIAALEPVWVLGNHELLLLGRLPVARAGPLVRRSMEWTRSVVPAALLRRLQALPVTAALGDGVVVTHGSLAGPTHRVRRQPDVAAELARLRGEHPTARLLVLGHTHRAMVADAGAARRWIGLRAHLALDPATAYVLNPGSVGQSRGFLQRAAAAVLDTAASSVRLVRVRYDASAVVRDLARLGLPPSAHHRSPVRRAAERAWRRVHAVTGLAGGRAVGDAR